MNIETYTMPRWFFSYRFVDLHARQLVARFAATAPVSLPMTIHDHMPRKSANVTIFAMRQIVDGAHRFQRDEKLNLFQRARLAQQLQDQMIERGYSAELVREMTSAVVNVA